MQKQNINFLFCNHPLYPKKVDEDYIEEYEAAREQHPCALFSFEDMEQGELSLFGDSISGLTIYRGWMMKPEMYQQFYSLLEERGIVLINTPEEYNRYHLLPGWYEDFSAVTAMSVWETEGELENILRESRSLKGSYIVKDYVKSRKHEWQDACFIHDIEDVADATKIIGNFVERQGDSLTGGIVLRKFENLRRLGNHEKSGMPISEEYRVFIYKGQILKVDDYWSTTCEASISEDEYAWIQSLVKKIKSNFVTMDLARKKDGTLMVMELGDGQVSGLQQVEAKEFYELVGRICDNKTLKSGFYI
nr:ATP-grasp domain-containing protein [Eubacterium sp.]